MSLRNTFALSVLTLLTAGCSSSQMLQEEVPEGTTRIHVNELMWKEKPNGVKVVILKGDPKKAGPFTMRLHFPKNFQAAVHKHPKTAEVTVISGDIFIGFGDEVNQDIATSFKAGDYFENAPNTWHYTFTKNSGAVVQLMGIGPWQKTVKNK
ncbi:MAG: cupin domain-containing protein [Lentisphaeraceae bacterium]|nr:cupin domain-containing protein [Lentisphaeraceae bacterium]